MNIKKADKNGRIALDTGSSHTSGRWEVRSDFRPRQIMSDGFLIARVYGRTQDEAASNANLMVASSGLMEETLSAIDIIEMWIENKSLTGIALVDAELLVEDLRKAIKSVNKQESIK